MTLQDLASYSPLITIAMGVVGIATILFTVGRWVQRLEGRFERIEARLDRLEGRMDRLSTWAAGFSKEINTFFGVIIQLLSSRQQLTPYELGLVTKGLAGLNDPAVQALFEHEEVSRNPLTPEELRRLEEYYRRARAGGTFTAAEVNDYNRLVAILEREKPEDPGVWPLVALGAFLLGIILARSAEDQNR